MNLSDLVRKLQKDIAELRRQVNNTTGGGGGGNHNILSATHPDSTPASCVRGDLITGQGASPLWKRLALGTSGYLLRSNGTDVVWDDISGVGGAPDDAEYIVGASHADLIAEKVKAQLYDNFDPDDYPSSPDALDDEFEDGSLAGKWTAVNDPGFEETTYDGFLWTTDINGILSATSFSNHSRLYQTPISGSGTWRVACKCAVSGLTYGTPQYMGAGVYLADTVPANDTFVGLNIQITSGGTSGRMNLQGLMDNGTGALQNMTSYEATYFDQTSWLYLMLEKATANAYTSANTYNAWFSFNGIIYTLISSCSKTFANAPAELGLWFRKPDTAGNHANALVDWFRRLA